MLDMIKKEVHVECLFQSFQALMCKVHFSKIFMKNRKRSDTLMNYGNSTLSKS